MIKNFQPSKARPIPYVDIFRDHITNTLKQPQAWGRVEPTFKHMQELRYSFNWDVITKSEMFNNPQMRVVQDNIEEYLRYCIFLSTKFKFGPKKQGGVRKFQSDWMMSWTGDKVKSCQMMFEISNMLYNYLILNFNQSVIYLKSKQSMSEYKGALEKLRYAKWAAKEMIKINQELGKLMKVPFELRPDSLEFLLGLTEGLSYLCFFYMFEDGSNPAVKGANLCSLEDEIAKWFWLCRNSMRSNKKLKKMMKDIYPDILSYYYNYRYNSLCRAVQLLGDLHNAQKNKGFIGIQYAYMLEAEALIKQMKNDDKFPDRDALKKRYERELKKLASDTKMKIDQVYKCPIPRGEQLNWIKPIQTKITAIEPKNIRIPPPDAPYFSSFFSEKVEGVRSSINLFVSNKKQHIQKSFFDLAEKLREIYTLNNVEALANCANLNDMVMNENFKTQLRVFKEVNGGAQAYHQINQNLDMYSQMIENQLQEADQLALTERRNDEQIIKTTGNANAMTSFEDANKAELNQLTRKPLITLYRTEGHLQRLQDHGRQVPARVQPETKLLATVRPTEPRLQFVHPSASVGGLRASQQGRNHELEETHRCDQQNHEPIHQTDP
jgi:hypothetical protein